MMNGTPNLLPNLDCHLINKLGAIRIRYPRFHSNAGVPPRDVLDPEKASRLVLKGLGRQGAWTNVHEAKISRSDSNTR